MEKCAYHDFGHTLAAIGDKLDLDASTAGYTVRHEQQRQNGKSQKRSGRPKNLSERDKREVVRALYCNPFASYQCIRDQSRTSLCGKTLRLTIRFEGYNDWEARKRLRPTKGVSALQVK